MEISSSFLRLMLVFLCIITISCLVSGAESKNADEWNDEGVELFEKELYEEAMVAFDKALLIDPRHEYAWFNLGLSFELQEQYENALQAFDNSTAINPFSFDAWYAKGRVLEILGKDDLAETAYATADKIERMEQGNFEKSDSDTIPALEKTDAEIEKVKDESGYEDAEFDLLYQKTNPKITESLHQINAWLSDEKWGEVDKKALKTSKFITEYSQELKALKLSPKYESIRDSYLFFLKQVSLANRGISDIASLYPVYFLHGNVNYRNKDDETDYKKRLSSVISTLGTARAELKRFESIY